MKRTRAPYLLYSRVHTHREVGPGQSSTSREPIRTRHLFHDPENGKRQLCASWRRAMACACSGTLLLFGLTGRM